MDQLATLEEVPEKHLPIYRLEAEILRAPQAELPIEHDFCAGLYARTMHIPAGTVLTGAVHRHESFFLIRRGELLVTTDAGVRHITAGDMFATPAGEKRAGVAITDCVVTTFHANPTNEKDPQAIWDLFTVPAPKNALEIAKRGVLA